MATSTPSKLDLEHQPASPPHEAKLDDADSSDSIVSEYKRTIQSNSLTRHLDVVAQKLASSTSNPSASDRSPARNRRVRIGGVSA